MTIYEKKARSVSHFPQLAEYILVKTDLLSVPDLKVQSIQRLINLQKHYFSFSSILGKNYQPQMAPNELFFLYMIKIAILG